MKLSPAPGFTSLADISRCLEARIPFRPGQGRPREQTDRRRRPLHGHQSYGLCALPLMFDDGELLTEMSPIPGMDCRSRTGCSPLLVIWADTACSKC